MPNHDAASEDSAAILRMAFAFVTSQTLYVAADLGIADYLAAGPLTAPELAATLGLHPDALARLAQALAAFGILRLEAGRFGLTATGQLLRSDSPRSLRATVRFLAGPWAWRAFEQLSHSVRSGESSFEHVWGVSNFDYWRQNPEVSAIHDEAMTGLTATEIARVLEAYDFTPFHSIVDVGGGNGALLAAILRRQPTARGILMDLPHVVELAPTVLRDAGVEARCEVVPGSFFESVPSGADLYLLKHIIHDWDDDRSFTILTNCNRSMGNDSRLLIIDRVLSDQPNVAEPMGYLVDMTMLAMTPGGRERTEGQFRALLASAGLRFERSINVGGICDIVEARRS
ncbi:MAG: hypothetical protein JO078_10910 [Candidatus Eremiobacteraeota bacterium]|nr:hypothetical protein [Candidatus Eremiobacteraeota bacterium]